MIGKIGGIIIQLSYFLGIDFFYNALLHDYRLWTYKKSILGIDFFHHHLMISILIMLFVYFPTVLIFLGNFPKRTFKQLLWITLWVFIFFLIEFISKFFNLIDYHNNWNIYWSVLLDLEMFLVLIIHFKKPLLAWIVSFIFFLFFFNIFGIPMKSFD